MSNVFEFGHRLIAGGFWDSVVGWFSNTLIWLGDILVTLIFAIFKFVLCIVDLMQILVERLVGIDFWGKPGATLDDIANSDIIFKFIYSDAVQRAFRSMIVVAIVLLIVFSIIAIIKSEYDVAANGNSKASSKVPIMRTALKSLLTVFLIPILLVMGVLASNAILTGIVNALNVNNDLTLGSQIFSVSAYSANRYRVYAITGDRYAASTKVNYAYAGNEAKGFASGVYVVDTFMEKINTRDYDADNPFEGLMYKVGGEWYLHKITAKDSDIALFGDNVALKRDVYEAFFRDSDDGFGASDVVTIPASAGNLKKMGSDDRQVKAAYNTWKFATRFEESQRFDDATDLGTRANFEAVSGKIYSNVIYPKNSESWGKYFDGGVKSYNNIAVNGTNSVLTYDYAPIVDEYYVLADVVDFMASNNLSVSYANISDPRIDWAYYGSDVYLDNFIGSTAGPNGAINRVLVDYSSTGRVGYTANLSASSEDAGALYIMCVRVGGALVPIVHGVDLDKGAATTVFRSSYLNPSYNGLIVARGVLNGGTGDNNYGYPTIITSSYTSGDKNAISLESPYYVHTTSSGSVFGGLSVRYDYEFDVDPWYATLKTDVDGDGNVVHGDYVLNEYNAMLGKENYNIVDGALQQKATLDTSNLLSRVARALPTSMKLYLFSGSGLQNQVQFSTLATNGGILNAEGKEVVFENIKPSANEAEAGELFWVLQAQGRWINCSVYKKMNSGPSEYQHIDIKVDLNFLMDNDRFEYVITYDNANIVYVVDSLDSAASALRENVHGEPAGANGTPVYNDGFSYSNSDPNDVKFIYSKKTGFVIKDSLKFAESVDEAFADNIDGSRIKNQTITSLTAENFMQYATVNPDDSYNNIVKADIKMVNLAPTFDNMVSAVFRNGVAVTKDVNFEVKGEAGDFYLVTLDLGANEKHSVKLKIDLYESNAKYIGAMRVDDVFRYGTSNGMQAVSFDPNWITTSDVIANVYDKALGTDGRLSNANTLVSYNVWTSAFRLDKIFGYANVIISDEFGEMRVVVFDQYGNAFPNTGISTDNKTVQMKVHSGFTEQVGVEIYESIAYNFSTYNAMTFIGPSPDGAAKKVYSYDPDTVNFYDSTNAFEFNGSNMVQKTLSEAERKTMAGLFQKFGAITATNYTLSVENVKIVSAECVDSSIKRDSTFYHKYEVVVEIFDGPKDSELSNLITKTTAFVEYEIGAVNREPEKFQTEVDVDLIRAIIAGDYTFVVGANTYDTLPDYDAGDVGALFLNGEFRKNISFVGNQVDSGFLGITLDFYLPGLLDLGDARFKIQTGTRNKPSEIVKHVFVDGRFEVSYTMTTDIAFIGATARPSFNTYYVPHKFNFIVFIFASIIIFNILFTSVWGLISRIYEIVVYFIVMPGVAAATVMDNGTMFGKWKKNLISKVFASYGVIIGLNLFFLLIPPLKEASKIFRDSDFAGINLDWIPGEYKAEFINQLIYLMFLLVAISMLKTLPGLISKLLDAGDVYSDGQAVRKNVKETTKEAMDGAKKYVSGQWAMDAGKKAANAASVMMNPFYNKETKHMRNFVPGSAIINEYLDRRRAKNEKNATDAPSDGTPSPETPNAPSGFDPGGADPTPLGAPENAATPAAETQVGQVFDPNGNPLGFDGQPLAGNGEEATNNAQEGAESSVLNFADYPEFVNEVMEVGKAGQDERLVEFDRLTEEINNIEKERDAAREAGKADIAENRDARLAELIAERHDLATNLGVVTEAGEISADLLADKKAKFVAYVNAFNNGQDNGEKVAEYDEKIEESRSSIQEKRKDLLAKKKAYRETNFTSQEERRSAAAEIENVQKEIIAEQEKLSTLTAERALLGRDKGRDDKTAAFDYLAYKSGTMSAEERGVKVDQIKDLEEELTDEYYANIKKLGLKNKRFEDMQIALANDTVQYGEGKNAKTANKYELFRDVSLSRELREKFVTGKGEYDYKGAKAFGKEHGLSDKDVVRLLENDTATVLENRFAKSTADQKEFEAFDLARRASNEYKSLLETTKAKEETLSELRTVVANDDKIKREFLASFGKDGAQGETGNTGSAGAQGETGDAGEDGTQTFNMKKIREELEAKGSLTGDEVKLLAMIDKAEKGKTKKFSKLSSEDQTEAIRRFNNKSDGTNLILDRNDERITKMFREEWNKTHADDQVFVPTDAGYEEKAIEIALKNTNKKSRADLSVKDINEAKDQMSYHLTSVMQNEQKAMDDFLEKLKGELAVENWNKNHKGAEIDDKTSAADRQILMRQAIQEFDDGQKDLRDTAAREMQTEVKNDDMIELYEQIQADSVVDNRTKREKSMDAHKADLEGAKQAKDIVSAELAAFKDGKHDDKTTADLVARLTQSEIDEMRAEYKAEAKASGGASWASLSTEERNMILRAKKEKALEAELKDISDKVRLKTAVVSYGAIDTAPVLAALKQVDDYTARLDGLTDSDNWSADKRKAHIDQMSSKDRKNYEKLLKHKFGSEAVENMKQNEAAFNKMLINQEKAVLKRGIDMTNGIINRDESKMPKKKAKLSDATTANFVGAEKGLIKKRNQELRESNSQRKKVRASIRKSEEAIAGQDIVDASTGAVVHKAGLNDAVKQKHASYKTAVETGDMKKIKKAEKELIAAYEAKRAEQDKRSQTIISKQTAELEKAVKAGNKEAEAEIKRKIEREKKAIESRAKVSENRSYLTSKASVLTGAKPSSAASATKKKTKSSGGDIENVSRSNQGAIDKQYKAEMEALIKKHMSSDEIAKALGRKQSGEVKNIRISPQEMRELSEVVKNKLSTQLQSLAARGGSSKTLEETQKAMIKKIKAEIKKMQDAEKRRADMMAKFGVKKDNKTGGSKKDDGEKKSSFKKADTQY